MLKSALYIQVALLLAAITACAAASAPLESEEAAKQAAKRFAETLGWESYGEPTEAKLREGVSAAQATHWRIEFSDDAIMRFDRDTGEVYTATALAEFASLDTAEPVEVIVDEQSARQAAESLLDRIGRPSDVVFDKSYQPPDTREWRFRWARTYEGIPYLYDSLHVRVSPVTGRVIGYGRQLISAPPTSAEVRVTEEDAISAARNAAASLGIPESVIAVATASLKVVQPNNYWGPGPTIEGWRVGGPSRVAWVVDLGDGGELKQFWIDAADASLLGGMQMKGAGSITRKLEGKPAEPSEGENKQISASPWPWLGAVVPLAVVVVLLCPRKNAAKGPG